MEPNIVFVYFNNLYIRKFKNFRHNCKGNYKDKGNSYNKKKNRDKSKCKC